MKGFSEMVRWFDTRSWSSGFKEKQKDFVLKQGMT